MSTINSKKEKRSESEKHLNWMGGAGYFVSDPIKQLELAATSCFFGEPQYYHIDEKDKRPVKVATCPNPVHALSPETIALLREELDALDPVEWRGKTPAELMTSAIDKALDFDAKRTLEFAACLRSDHYIRTTPQVILVRASHHKDVRGTSLLREYGTGYRTGIVQRADEPALGLAYHISAYGKDAPIPNGLKKVWRRALESYNDYQLAKYRMGGREVKLVDVVNLVHPKSDAIGRLVKGELRNEDTWESRISKLGSNREAWEGVLDKMGHMALLRNIRNLLKADVPYSKFLPMLVAGVKDGRQLPFRYYSAYKSLAGAPSPVKDSLEECITASLHTLPKFAGKTMFLCDNSGSAWSAATSSMGTMHVAEIANLTAVLGAHLSDEGWIGVFGDTLRLISVSKKGSVLEQVEKVSEVGMGIGQGTENGIWLFWDRAIQKKEHWDNVFVFSDMQAGHGGLYGMDGKAYASYMWNVGGSKEYIEVGIGRIRTFIDVGKLVNAYREKVNPNVNVFLVQVAGYQDTIIPEFYNKTYILGGWGEGLFKFAHQVVKTVKVSDKCRKENIQNCHSCDDKACGDNLSK